MNCSTGSALRPGLRRTVAALLLGSLASALPMGTAAQIVPRTNQQWVQTGLAAIPGLGLQLGYVSPRSFYTVEGVVSADATPSFSGGEGSLQVSLGLGGALRPLGVMQVLGNTRQTAYDVHLGLRLGPSLFFSYGESSRTENPFSLYLEPYVRLTSRLPSRRTVYAELGLQRPVLRGGIWLNL